MVLDMLNGGLGGERTMTMPIPKNDASIMPFFAPD